VSILLKLTTISVFATLLSAIQRMKLRSPRSAQQPSRLSAMGLYRFQGCLETGRTSLLWNWPIYPRTLVSLHTDADQCRTVGKSRTPPVIFHTSLPPVLDTENRLFSSRCLNFAIQTEPFHIVDAKSHYHEHKATKHRLLATQDLTP
jgi:hypothetical protein